MSDEDAQPRTVTRLVGDALLFLGVILGIAIGVGYFFHINVLVELVAWLVRTVSQSLA